MIDPQDPRRAQRELIDLPCELIVEGWDEPIGHSMVDASIYGAWVRSSFPGEVGDVVVCCFSPPGWQERELMVFAEVKRVLQPSRTHTRRGMALQFIDLSKNEQIALQMCLSATGQRMQMLS